MSKQEAEIISTLNAAVVGKAIEDASFRAKLVADPKAAVEAFVKTPLPAGFTLKVVESGANEFTIVLPYESKAGAGGELSDADLESVAGGSKSGAKAFFGGVREGFNMVWKNPIVSAVGSASAGVITAEAGGVGGAVVGATLCKGI